MTNVVQSICAVASENPVIRWQIIALNTLRSFYDDRAFLADFRLSGQFTRALLEKKCLQVVFSTLFPLDDDLLEAKVELLVSFVHLVGVVASTLKDEQFPVVRELLGLLCEVKEFDVFRMSLAYATTSGNTNVRDRKVSLHRGFLAVLDLFSHVLTVSSVVYLDLVQCAVRFFQRNRQVLTQILKLQSQPFSVSELEKVSAFVDIVTAAALRRGTSIGGSYASALQIVRHNSKSTSGVDSASQPSFALHDVWEMDTESVLVDMYRILHLLGKVTVPTIFCLKSLSSLANFTQVIPMRKDRQVHFVLRH